MRQKDDQPFTELLNRFRTASQTEGDIQCIQSRLVHPKDTDYPVSIVLYFWDSFSYISCLFFISLNCFFSNSIFFLCWLHCFIALFFFYIYFLLSFLSNTLHEHVANSILYCPRVLYFSSIFLMASTGEAIPFMFLVYWIGDACLFHYRAGGNTYILIFLWV